jgi:two-component system sensor histidine kinase YesM
MIMLSTNRFTYKYDYDLMNSDEWRKDIYDAKGGVVISLNSNGVAKKQGDKPMVTIGRAIYDIDSQDRTGIMLMNISGAIFDVMLAQLRYNDICIMGIDGTFIAGNRKYADYFGSSFTGEKTVHKSVRDSGKRILLSGCKVSGLPLVILRASDYGTGGTPVRVIIVLLILLIIFLAVAVIIGTFIRKNITVPVYELSASMDRNKQSGNLKKIETKMPNSELDMLESDYNDLIDHVNELIATLVEKEQILQSAELRVLQEQIKPHFLYNSIETIGFMALDAGADKVHDALETMGSFYRNFLSKGGREIPFSREIRIVKDYLSLQKLRYGDIIEDEYEIDEAAESFIVPKLILQPLVENSIYHGIRLKGEAGVIKITGNIVDGALHIIVRDTGVGMSQEQIGKVLSQDKSDRPSEADSSFGLWGTIERIRIYCGVKDCVKITSEIGEYTEIEIIIKQREELAAECVRK